tara:strand:- start:1132 stop:2673 length:1542 start_codon:yes stop_codon:yes gene_type:complete
MELKFFGHASVYIKTDKVSIVTDPWFSKKGAFLGSWYQFPDNTEIDFSWTKDLDYVCLSHEHEDHYDIEFLKSLNKDVKIIIPNYGDDLLYDEISKILDNEIIQLNTREKIQLGDVTFCAVIQSIPGWDDAALIFETPQGVVANINDMKLTDVDLTFIKDNFRIKYLFKQFSGASWYPMVYPYSDEEKDTISKKSVINKFNTFINVCNDLEAEYNFPTAGPPCFLDDDLIYLNTVSYSRFPDQSDFYYYSTEKNFKNIDILLPGDSANIADIAIQTENNLKSLCFTDKKKYLNQYKLKRVKEIDDHKNKFTNPNYSLIEKCKNHFEPLIKSSRFFRKQIDSKILLNLIGNGINEKIVVDFTDANNCVYHYNEDEIIYTFNFEAKYAELIFDGKLQWEELFLSLKFSASRSPDVHNEFLMIFLKYADIKSFKNYQKFYNSKMRNDTFELTRNGEVYEVQKYCPHAFGDMSKGVIDGDYIYCPLHNWCFSLIDGKGKDNVLKLKISKKNDNEKKI